MPVPRLPVPQARAGRPPLCLRPRRAAPAWPEPPRAVTAALKPPCPSAAVFHRKYAFTFKTLSAFCFSNKRRKYLKCPPLFLWALFVL